MAGITQTASRVRVEDPAKKGTLGSQSGLNADQIKFDTNISTNNGNLEASPSFRRRHVTIRRGEANEECQLIQSVDGVDDTKCNVYNDWDSAPVSGDSYDIAYKLEDAATVAGCDFETDSRQWTMSKKLVLGIGTTTFGYLGMSHGQILRLEDSGPSDEAFEVNGAGRFEIGTIKNDLAERGAQLLFTNDADGETVMNIANGAVVRLFEFGIHSARAPDGVTGLVITVGATANVEWARGQTSGMNTPFKNRYERLRDVFGDPVYLTRADVVASPMWDGHLKSEIDKTVYDFLQGEPDALAVRILFEG